VAAPVRFSPSWRPFWRSWPRCGRSRACGTAEPVDRRRDAECSSVGIAGCRPARLNGVAGIRSRPAQAGGIVAVGDVGPPRLVGVDAEVVEELAAAVARHTALADRARMYGDDLLGCAPAAGRAGPVLDEVHRP